MGDILHALPAVTALRMAHPHWIIDWVVEPRWQPLLAAPGFATRGAQRPIQKPLIDRVHYAPTRQWRKAPFSRRTIRDVLALRNTLCNGKYDVVIDLQGAIRSAVIARMAGSRRVIGEAEPREYIAHLLFTEHVATRGAHVIQQDVELASAIAGDTLDPQKPWLPVDPASEAWCDRLLAAVAGQPVALINPGAGWGAKCWPVQRYATVAQGLIQQGFRVLVNAGPGEEPLAQSIVSATSGAATALSASLDHLIALTRRAALFIAGDTGPLHLACALGRPVVGIYGPTDPSRNGPFGTRFRVLRSPLSRRDHTRNPNPEAGLLTIQPQDVLEAAAQLMAGEKAQ